LITLNNPQKNDSIAYYIQTRQTEVFYYSGLLQFGLQSSNKTIKIAEKIKDSIFIADAYLFKALIYEAQDSLIKSIEYANIAKLFFPKKEETKYRTLITYSQIINHLAQVNARTNSLDEAYYYKKRTI
jgi:hypothetical protein